MSLDLTHIEDRKTGPWATPEAKSLIAEVKLLRDALAPLLAVFDDVEVLDTPELAMRDVRLTLDSTVLWNARAALEGAEHGE